MFNDVLCSRSSMWKWLLMKNVMIAVLGFCGFLAGTLVALETIVEDLSNENDDSICSGGIGANRTFPTTTYNESFISF